MARNALNRRVWEIEDEKRWSEYHTGHGHTSYGQVSIRGKTIARLYDNVDFYLASVPDLSSADLHRHGYAPHLDDVDEGARSWNKRPAIPTFLMSSGKQPLGYWWIELSFYRRILEE